MLIDPTDADLDGMPDQWETLYGISTPSGDPDQDGLTNLQEYKLASIPLYADSDKDGFYDGEEYDQGYNVCGAGSLPLSYTNSKMKIYGSSKLTFTQAANQAKQASQTFQILNAGVGEMQWGITPSQTWITLSQTSGSGPALIKVNVNLAGLAPGTYTGTITIQSRSIPGDQPSGPSGARPVTETVVISVQFTVQPTQEKIVFIPVVNKR
jgi:hypothetical protein